ncbi:MAG: HpsJ family protein [Synechococcus sp.]|nr:HpsJ family protein [Synechococcus sp.]
MAEASTSRIAGLFRWIGGVLVLLLGLRLGAVLVANAWGQEAYRQLVVDTLINGAPLALIGLLLMLVGSRLDFPTQLRTPLRWTVLVVGALLSLSLFVSVPVMMSGNRLIQADADRAVNQKRTELEQAQAESKNPKLLEMLEGQLEQAGQVSADAKPEDKKAQVQALIDQRLEQLNQQLTQAEQARDLTMGQRRLGGTAVALLLALAMLAVALAAVL